MWHGIGHQKDIGSLILACGEDWILNLYLIPSGIIKILGEMSPTTYKHARKEKYCKFLFMT